MCSLQEPMLLRSRAPKKENITKPDLVKIHNLPYIKYLGNIFYYTDNIDCAVYCDELLKKIEKADDIFLIGFDMEWPFSFQTGPGKTALIQLSPNINDCVLFHVTNFNKLPKALTEVLSHNKVRLLGVNIKNDLHKLSRDFPGINKEPMLNNCIDLRTKANSLLKCKRNWSMQKLVNHFLKLEINKDKRVRNSKWNIMPLTNSQQLYAAIDAYASLRLYLHLINMETEDYAKSLN